MKEKKNKYIDPAEFNETIEEEFVWEHVCLIFFSFSRNFPEYDEWRYKKEKQ